MGGMLEPEKLFPGRGVERANLARHDVIVPPFHEKDGHLQPRRLLKEIDRKELAPEVLERKLRAARQPDSIGEGILG